MNNMVLILDDEPIRAERWCSDLSHLFEDIKLDWHVSWLQPDSLDENIAVLIRRRAAARAGQDLTDVSAVDDAGILVVDYDLLNLSRTGPYLTGDDVAYLARCYSSCGIIVGVNQFDKRGPTFDLTMLGHPKEFADVHINAALLASRGLWSTSKAEEFRPWQWPVLPYLAEQVERGRSFIASNLNNPVLGALGLSDDDLSSLPTRAISYLQHDPSSSDDAAATAKPLQSLLCRDIASIRPGLRGRDILASNEQLANLVESRLRHFLDEIVLPEQQLLVDLPHLVARMPGALAEPKKEELPRAVTVPIVESGDALAKDVRAIVRNNPLDVRPTVNWRELTANSDLLKVLSERSMGVARTVFAEDVSELLPVEECTEFLSELELSYPRRFIKQVPRVDYQPATNLALA